MLRSANRYLRALRTLPKVSIHYGHFLESVTRMPKSNPPPNTVEVIKREEKGSDVNLATYLLVDAFANGGQISKPLAWP
jgi:hypothetical protein